MPKIVDHNRQRNLIADACFELLATEGFAAMSMRRLAKSAGVSTGTLYHYFPDKDAILLHLFDQVTQRDAMSVQAVIEEHADLPGRLDAVLTWAEQRQDHLGRVLRVAIEIQHHDESEAGRKQLTAAARRYRMSLAESLKVEDSPVLGMLFSTFLGVLIHRQLDPRGADFQTIRQHRAMLAMLLGGT